MRQREGDLLAALAGLLRAPEALDDRIGGAAQHHFVEEEVVAFGGRSGAAQERLLLDGIDLDDLEWLQKADDALSDALGPILHAAIGGPVAVQGNFPKPAAQLIAAVVDQVRSPGALRDGDFVPLAGRRWFSELLQEFVFEALRSLLSS